MDNNALTPLNQVQVPSTEELLADYRARNGRINENMSDLYPFDENEQNIALMTTINSRFTSIIYNNCYNLMLSGDNLVIIELIRQHHDIVVTLNSN